MRPITTLFLLMSLDGKISTGSNDTLDVDKDFPKLNTNVSKGLYQYYDIEQTTDLWSFNSGKVLAKVGINNLTNVTKTIVNFVVVDNTHLTYQGIKNMIDKSNTLVLVTSNKDHPAYKFYDTNLHIIYQDKLDLYKVLEELYSKYKVDRITLQTGSTLNSIFLRNKLIDYVDIVVAPVLIGGYNTPTLIDGESINDISQLDLLSSLVLIKCEPLKYSYVRLKYKVVS